MEGRRSTRSVTRKLKEEEEAPKKHMEKLLLQQIIQIPVVTDYFLNFLPTSDILSCSSVSKAWNSLSREFLRRRRQCLLKCILYDPPGLADRLSVLEDGIVNNNHHPFTGLYLVISEKTVTIMSNPKVDNQIEDSLRDITQKISTMKRVIFEFQEGRMATKLVPVYDLVFRTLPVSEIESLLFFGEFYAHWADILYCVPDQGFSKLKKFECQCRFFTRYNELMYEEILKRCPALTELDMGVECMNVGIFKKFDKSSVIKSVRALRNQKLTFGGEQMKIFEEGNIALEVFDLEDCAFWEPEQFQCVYRILQLNSKSLRKFICRYTQYQAIFKIQIPPMPDIQEVTLIYEDMHGNDEQMRNHPHLRKLFPNAVIIPVRIPDIVTVRTTPTPGDLTIWLDQGCEEYSNIPSWVTHPPLRNQHRRRRRNI